MKPSVFEYTAVASVEEAVAELAQHGDAAKLLAGGQSLVPLLNMRLATPARLIDLNRVAALAHITLRAGGLVIGAMTRQRTVERSALATLNAPLLGDALPWVGHFQIRNRGTVGGSLSHADPAAELPAVALCLDARFTARGPKGERTLGADEFFRTQLVTALEPTELLTEVWFPPMPRAAGSAWLELARRHGDYALVGVGAVVALAGDRIGEARLALTGVGDRPMRMREAEARLAGELLTPEVIGDVAEAIRRAIDPGSDIHATAAYRRHIAGVLASRAIRLAAWRAKEAARA
jgi:aerobic carbon-monoxide dehydrogenase medium subunit